MLFRIFGYLKNSLKPSGMKQFFSMLGLLAFFAAALVSCESDEDGKVPDPGLSDAALSRLVVRYDEARRTADEVGRALGRTVEYESFYVRKTCGREMPAIRCSMCSITTTTDSPSWRRTAV